MQKGKTMKRVKGKRDKHRRGGPTKEELKALNKEHGFLWSRVSFHPSNPGKSWVVMPHRKISEKTKYRNFRTRESAIDAAFCVDLAIEDLTTPDERETLSKRYVASPYIEDEDIPDYWPDPKEKFCSLCKTSVGFFYPAENHYSYESYGVYFCSDEHRERTEKIFEYAQKVWQGKKEAGLLDKMLDECKQRDWNSPVDIFNWMI